MYVIDKRVSWTPGPGFKMEKFIGLKQIVLNNKRNINLNNSQTEDDSNWLNVVNKVMSALVHLAI